MSKLWLILILLTAYSLGLYSGYLLMLPDPALRFACVQTDYDKTIYQIITSENHFQLQAMALELDMLKQQKGGENWKIKN